MIQEEAIEETPEIEIEEEAPEIDASLNSEAASTPHPGVASAVVTINFISALPETRPTPP